MTTQKLQQHIDMDKEDFVAAVEENIGKRRWLHLCMKT